MAQSEMGGISGFFYFRVFIAQTLHRTAGEARRDGADGADCGDCGRDDVSC